MYGYITWIALLLAAHLSVTQAQRTCCMPTHFEAERFFLEGPVRSIIVADYVRQKVFEIFDRSSKVYNIYDLTNERIYMYDENGCTFHHSDKVKRFGQCITDESCQPQSLRIGNELFQSYTINWARDIRAHRFMMGPESGCLPFMTQIKGKTLTETMLYSRLNTSISDWGLYNPFQTCDEVVRPEQNYGF